MSDRRDREHRASHAHGEVRLSRRAPAADEIGLAVIAISMTIVAVFSPVSFMSGIAGQYFRQFGLTVAIAVFFSLMVARLITPVVAAYFLRAHHDAPRPDGPVMRFYTRLVRSSVRHRWVTLAAGLLLFVASLMSTKLLPSGLHSGGRCFPLAARDRAAAGLAPRGYRQA